MILGVLAVLSYLALDFLTGLVVGYFVLLVSTNRKPNRQRVLVIALIWTVMGIIIDGIRFLILHK